MKPARTTCLWRPSSYICTSCIDRSARTKARYLSSHTNPHPPPTTAFAPLPSRRLISLLGPDSTHYLQGVITSNSSPSTLRTSGFYTAFLNAQGRLLNDVFIYPYKEGDKEGWLIEVDAKEVERLARHVKRYKLRAKFDVKIVDIGELRVWSQWSEDAGWTAHSLDGGPSSSASDGNPQGGSIGCEDKRAPGMGRRLILPDGKKPEIEAEEVSEESYRVRRYLKGVPEGQDELVREAALPQESCIDFMGGIDYRKGCYVGQELTIRTHHTGVVRKRVLPVMFYGKDEAAPKNLEYDPGKEYGVDEIPRETNIGRVEKRGRSAGKFLSGVGNVGLGLCRLANMTDLTVAGEPGSYKEGDEFKLEWEVQDSGVNLVKVKAFVPSWHLTRQ